MKFALILLLCAGAALARIEEWNWLNRISPDRKVEDTAFRPGREYQFFYNGQLATGVVGSSNSIRPRESNASCASCSKTRTRA